MRGRGSYYLSVDIGKSAPTINGEAKAKVLVHYVNNEVHPTQQQSSLLKQEYLLII